MRQLDGTQRETKPRADEVEISVIGPGFGECIVVHLSDDEWVIVDSCSELENKRPVALTYLESLGVDPAERVTNVIASHWHDDHIRGIVDTCLKAKFFCSHALGSKEFQTVMGFYNGCPPAGGAGISELLKVRKVIEKRRTKGELVAPNFALARTILFDREGPTRISLKALSPSSPACEAALVKIATTLTPQPDADRIAVPTLEPNDLAVVLSLRVADIRVLLGADLEEMGRAGLGWQAVVADFANEGRHCGFKIPHHGSENGFYQPVWDSMLTRDCWAVLTPYSRGKLPLPAPEDQERITGLSPDAFLTARLRRVVFRHPNNAITRTLRDMNVEITEEPSEQGHVRFRKRVNSSDDWTVELFKGAHRLVNPFANRQGPAQ